MHLCRLASVRGNFNGKQAQYGITVSQLRNCFAVKEPEDARLSTADTQLKWKTDKPRKW